MDNDVEFDDEITTDDSIDEEKRLNKRKRVRQLKQYQGMSDEEFNKKFDNIETGLITSKHFETQINEKLKEFELDYDLTDLKVNDKSVLRALIQALLSLEKFEQMAFKIQSNLTKPEYASIGLADLERLNRVMTVIRTDISRMQEDLKITRKTRKSDREESVIAYIDNIKARSRKFLESRYGSVYCPNCKMLIGRVWAKDGDNSNNKFWFYCKRCDERVIITFPELLKNGLKNVSGVPDF